MNSTEKSIKKEKITEEKKENVSKEQSDIEEAEEILNYFSFINQPNRRKNKRN